MADIETKADIMEWFSDCGDGKSKQGFDIETLSRLVEHGQYDHPASLWSAVYDYSFCARFRANAWFTRTGMVYTCQWAGHEMLLKYMGLTILEVEEAGWVRVSGTTTPSSVQGRFKPSPRQLRAMRHHGVVVDLRDPNRRWLQVSLPDTAPFLSQYEK